MSNWPLSHFVCIFVALGHFYDTAARVLSPRGEQNGQIEAAVNERLELLAARSRRARNGMSQHNIVADKLLRTVPIALCHRRRQPFLIDLAAAQPDVLGMMDVA